MHFLLPNYVSHVVVSPLCSNSVKGSHFSGAAFAGTPIPQFSCVSPARVLPLHPARTAIQQQPQRRRYSSADLFLANGGAYGGPLESTRSSSSGCDGQEKLWSSTNCCEDTPNTVNYNGKLLIFGDYRRSLCFENLVIDLVAFGAMVKKALIPMMRRTERISGKEIILQPKLNSPKGVDFPNSCFKRVEGLKVHYLKEDPKAVDGADVVAPRTVLHMTHGFGAFSASWMPVITQLSGRLGAIAVAHDTPGFGLTERPSWWNTSKYALQCNTDIAKALVQHVRSEQSEKDQGSLQYIMMGHSVGCITAANASLSDSLPPEKTTLILVAPIMSAPPSTSARSMMVSSGEEGTENSGEVVGGDGESDAVVIPPTTSRRVLRDALNKVGNVVCAVGARSCAGLRFVVNSPSVVMNVLEKAAVALFIVCVFPLLYPLSVMGLRAVAYRGNFWRAVLRWVWFEKSDVDVEVVNRYRWPTLARFWDRGISLFMIHRLRSGLQGMTGEPRLLEDVAIKAAQGMKVVVIQGNNDTVACLAQGFIADATAIADTIPQAKFLNFADCGHVPQEERPEEFVKAVVKQIGHHQ